MSVARLNIIGWLAAAQVAGALAGAAPPAPVLERGPALPRSAPGTVRSASLVVETSYGASRQVNVDAQGRNIVGDAANEPSLCLDPTNPNRIAIGWRQFNRVTSDFREAGWAWSTNGGVSWQFPGVLQPGVFRSDPVLASDADGRFYYLSLTTNPVFRCDLWRSTNGGAAWDPMGLAVGGDKAWLAIDTTAGPGRGHLYQAWSWAENFYGTRVFSRSVDGGVTWSDPVALPQTPYWGTPAVGPDGELYVVGWTGSAFVVNRATNAWDRRVAVRFDQTRTVNLGGSMTYQGAVNPDGLLGQAWLAVDRSTGPTRGSVYVLCSVQTTNNPTDVMFARSTDGGLTWSAPRRLNDDPARNGAWHWFGTLSVAPNGRLDACWNDTRSRADNTLSELYYTYSFDGGRTWARNMAVSPPFNHALGYPVQRKMGDYIGMVSLKKAACIAYAATFNGEEDIFYLRIELPVLSIARVAEGVHLTWNTVPGRTYCVEAKEEAQASWPTPALGCVTATNTTLTFLDATAPPPSQRLYRVVERP